MDIGHDVYMAQVENNANVTVTPEKFDFGQAIAEPLSMLTLVYFQKRKRVVF